MFHLRHRHKNPFKCLKCKFSFSCRDELLEHWCGKLQSERLPHQCDAFLSFKCGTCKILFWTEDEMELHFKLLKHSPPLELTCSLCTRRFNTLSGYERHSKLCKLRTAFDAENPYVVQMGGGWHSQRFLGDVISIHAFQNLTDAVDPNLFFINSRSDISDLLLKEMTGKGQLRFKLDIQIEFERLVDGVTETSTAWFGSKYMDLLTTEDLEGLLDEAILKTVSRVSEYNNRGSNWTVSKVLRLDVKCAMYRPLGGGCCIELPDFIKKTRAVINLKTEGNSCFLFHVLYHILERKSNQGEKTVRYLAARASQINMDGIRTPVTLADIPKFEKQNNIAINVFFASKTREGGTEVPRLSPLRISEHISDRKPVDLLLISEESNRLEEELFNCELSDADDLSLLDSNKLVKGRSTPYHFCLITNLSRLIRPFRVSTHKTHVCRRCLKLFSKEERYIAHEKDCVRFKPQRVLLPDRKSNLCTFSAYKALLKPWAVIYCDFECILTKESTQSSNVNLTESSTTSVSKHIPFSYGFSVVNWKNETIIPCKTRTINSMEEDAGELFLKEIQSVYSNVLEPLMKEVEPIMTEDDARKHKMATSCEECGTPFNPLKKDLKKCLHHDHKDGRYLMTCCVSCNLKIQQTDKIPVVLMNSMRYDTHIIWDSLGKVINEHDFLTVIPKTRENYIGFQLNNLVFLDAYQFFASSLDSVAQSLSIDDLNYVYEHFGKEKGMLFRRKGVFPYSYVTSLEVLSEKGLPDKSCFKNDLTGEDISDEDYKFAWDIFNSFNCITLGDFSDVYLRGDVLLLQCAFETFRRLVFQNYELEATAFYTTPGLAFESALRMTKAKVELITDEEMMMLVERGMMGGISQQSHRYFKSNVPAKEGYDSSKPTAHILYLDLVNLYGLMQTKPLPYRNYKWVSHDCLDKIDVTSLSETDEIGYIFEVDLFVPKDADFHEKFSDFPLAPTHRKVKVSELSPTQKLYSESAKESSEKIILDMFDKQDYVLHGLTLQTYARLGLKFFIRRAISFVQKAWLKPFIEFNTELRKKATTAYEKNLFKLFNNSNFGKLLQCQRKKRCIFPVFSKKKLLRSVSLPNFHDFSVFSNNLIIVELKKPCVVLDKPIANGFTVLSLAKEYVYHTYYDVIKPIFEEGSKVKGQGSKVRLGYCDTDSYIIYVQCENLIETLKPYASKHFDFSNLPSEHPLFSLENAAKPGCLKDEVGGAFISESIHLKSKMYMFTTEGGVEKKVAKGVHRSCLKHQVKRQDYLSALSKAQGEGTHRVVFHRFVTDGSHHLSTVRQVKRGISGYSNKRWMASDNIHSFPYGFLGKKRNLKINM